MAFIRRIRFFVSWLIFEYFMKQESADKKADKIIKAITKYNDDHKEPRCKYCGHNKLFSKVSFVSGLLASTLEYFYECCSCGNQQPTNGSSYRYTVSSLKQERIINDGGNFRYYIIAPDFVTCLLYLFCLLMAAIFVYCCFGMFFGI